VEEDAWISVIENIYKVSRNRDDYINPTTNGEMSWRSVNYYDTDSEATMERWQNKLYEVSIRWCSHILKKE
jgi:hypothetical protein